ncbi:MAG: anaerobic ribonucleoside-triphosphate reductase activating protein [Clostridia bacterium]|nr:anaerobic ribonucleoside-triphosphate reductase activating protein [Clostridia bacterium]
MNVQGYQKLSLLDFPGKVACTVFTGGCNLRCPFCHNASLVRAPRENPDQTEELFSYLESRRGILEGVCVTGGEPTLQPDLPEFIGRLKKMGYSVKLDTNGSNPSALRALLERNLLDYVAMDIKSAPSSYERAVGKKTDFAPFEESIRLLRESKISYEFRTTAVKGIHRREDFEEIGRFLAGEKRYFLQSFRDSGNVLESGYGAFDDAETAEWLAIIRKTIPSARLRGQEE